MTDENQINNKIFIQLLENNQSFLIKAYELQNRHSIEESVACLEKISQNFHTLGNIADQIPYTASIIRENREMLSYAHIEKLNEGFPFKTTFDYKREKNDAKKKQLKNKWAPQEHELFLEGIKLFGVKSLKKVAEHVKTRTVNQVRSHLQKIQLRESRLKEKNRIKELKAKENASTNNNI